MWYDVLSEGSSCDRQESVVAYGTGAALFTVPPVLQFGATEVNAATPRHHLATEPQPAGDPNASERLAP